MPQFVVPWVHLTSDQVGLYTHSYLVFRGPRLGIQEIHVLPFFPLSHDGVILTACVENIEYSMDLTAC